MNDAKVLDVIEAGLRDGNGILRLDPTWIARPFLPSGRRLGLPEDMYDCGRRGTICERWLGSTTRAANEFGPADEGLSYLRTQAGESVRLADAIQACGNLIMGTAYAETHASLGRLAKVFDYGCRIYFHLHQRQDTADQLGMNSKEEAYYFLDADLGRHPETFFGLHPWIVEKDRTDILLPYLEDWNSDLILGHSRCYPNLPGEGFHVPPGILHAPGTALTLELQEDSDIFSCFQAVVDGIKVDKSLLFKFIPQEDWVKRKEVAALELCDWELNGDPYFYENHHMLPVPVEGCVQQSAEEVWIFYNSQKFSGKRTTLRPEAEVLSCEAGVFNLLVWKGEGTVGGHVVEAGRSGFDELLVCHETATNGVTIRNTGRSDLVIFKFFGPDINHRAPMLPKYVP